MSNKIALVSGGTSGVGLSLVKALAKLHYHVHFIGTNNQLGEKLEKEIQACSSGGIHFIPLDLSKLHEVNLFVEHFLKKQEHLDLLVNTAGIIQPGRLLTAEGLEKTFAVGYLSAFVLANGLIPLLEKAQHARILNVGAAPATILKPRLDMNDLDFAKSYSGFKASIATVHAKTVLIQMLAEKLSPKKIDVNSFHPGMVRSKLSRHLPLPLRLVSRALSPFMSAASQNGIWACTAQEIGGMSGKLFVNKKPISLDFDKAYQQQLWQKTEEIISSIMSNTNTTNRKPNFKLGWISSQNLAGLTHFHSEITQEDMIGVNQGAAALLQNVEQEFHMIIDNRLAPMKALFTLEALQGMSPLLKHPFLKYLVVVKPLHLSLEAQDSIMQEALGVCLKNVSSIAEAFAFMKQQQALKETFSDEQSFFPADRSPIR